MTGSCRVPLCIAARTAPIEVNPSLQPVSPTAFVKQAPRLQQLTGTTAGLHTLISEVDRCAWQSLLKACCMLVCACVCMQAWRVSERLGLIGPACEQPEYNMFARTKVEEEFVPIYEK